MTTSRGGAPFTVCVVPAAAVCKKIAVPLPSLTSTQDFSLNVNDSVTSATAGDDVAAVAAAVVSMADAAVIEAAVLSGSVAAVGVVAAIGASVFRLSNGLGSAVDDCPR